MINRELDKCEQFGWFSWEEMPSPLFFPIVNLMKSGFNLNNVINNSWQHYKGNRYQVPGEGRHSDTLEEFIVYQGLYNSKEFGNKSIWIRSKKVFQENVIINGKEVPRFKIHGIFHLVHDRWRISATCCGENSETPKELTRAKRASHRSVTGGGQFLFEK